MKVGIFTFHFAKNYGAVLQAHALASTVRALGADCEIVDYRYPWMFRGEGSIRFREHYALHRLRDCKAVSVLKALRRWTLGWFRTRSEQDRLYEEFVQAHLPLSRRVRDWELAGLPHDALVCGSDQIWNARITGRLAAPYFLAFPTSKPCRRIAYAASAGSGRFRPADEPVAARWIAGLNAVGVRERMLAETVRRLVPSSRPEIVLDPAFLPAEDHWIAMARRPAADLPERFLLLYIVEESAKSAWIYRAAQTLAAERKLRIVKIVRRCDDASGMPVDLDIIPVENCGPLEFLWLFSNASFVLAGSFHATVFSIVFCREFLCLPHPTDRERTDSLLANFGLGDRTLEPGVAASGIPPVDWHAVRPVLEKKRKDSLSFLKTALGIHG